ncbi:MAG: hypothetical protein A2W17_11575 [Planctomycetes bacterium RBG_16_41_13]|nr:MAG: hypothetical protein A2W17_11575 [Planctomycetes bacterium RBG_16_41_13]
MCLEIDKKLRIFEAVLSEMTELVFIGDANGNILYVNKAFQAITGYKSADIAGKSFAFFLDGENLKRAMDNYAMTLKGKNSEYELCFNNTGILYEYKNIPLKDEKDHIIGVIGIASDVTEWKQIKKEHRLLNELEDQFLGNHTKEPAKISDELQMQIVQHKRVEEERNNKINSLQSLIDFSNLMNNEVLEAEIVKHTSLILKNKFKSDILSVLMLNNQKNVLNASAVIPAMPLDKFARKELFLNPSLCNVIKTGQAFLVKDIDKDIPCDCLLYNVGMGGYMCLPLIAGGETIGVVQMIKKENGYWDNAETHRLISAYIGLVANAIHRVRLTNITKLAAITDALTGVYNRGYFDDMLEKFLALAKRNNEPLSVLLADIDYFKSINDTYGHLAGDILLQEVTKSISHTLRKSDTVSRYGGEAFAIILPATDMMSAIEKAEKIRKYVRTIEFDKVVTGKSLKLTISIGVANFPEHGAECESVITAADSALYKAKRSGRNRVETP